MEPSSEIRDRGSASSRTPISRRPCRLLLLSDTHGHLDIINELAERTDADAAVHAGDFGFYDRDSAAGLGKRELLLRIVHSPLPAEEKRAARKLPREQMEDFVRERCPLSQMPEYLEGRKAFTLPVFAVWGNHEDHRVVESFYTGGRTIENLHVLHEKETFHIGRFHIFGLGGNVIVGPKLFQRPLAGGSGKVWATLSQLDALCAAAEENAQEGEIRLLVSHVSPGKEPLVSIVGARTRADFAVSGHMGAPFCMVWNEFAISEVGEAASRMQGRAEHVLDISKPIGREEGRHGPTGDEDTDVAAFGRLPEETVPLGRRPAVPRWYARMKYINLPDAQVGYAVLTDDGEALSLETRAEGYRP